MQFKFLSNLKSSLGDTARTFSPILYRSLYRSLALTPITISVAAAFVALTAPGGQAQNLFSPVIQVNDDSITWYELDQRTKFLVLLGAPGDPADLAREVLIEERLKKQAIARTEIEVTPDQIEIGIEEFAGRTELSSRQFIKALADGGVAPETLRDFVKIGLLWRRYARNSFLEDAKPTPAEVDHAFSKGKVPEIMVLLSEIIIPVTPQTQGQAEELAKQISGLRRADEFADAATKFSAASTRENGGKMNWLSLNKLPGGLRPMFLAMVPGEVSSPVFLPNAIAIFRMRAIQEASVPRPHYAQIDYASYFIPGGRSAEALAVAQTLRDKVDVCDDLYGVAQGQPASVLQRQNRAPGEIPRDIAFELAKLDRGEVSTALTSNNGQNLVFLMLCGRTTSQTKDATREEVAQALTIQRFEFLSAAFLNRLEADARIVNR